MLNKNKHLPYLLLLTISIIFASETDFIKSNPYRVQDISLTDTVFITATRVETKIYSLPISTVLISQCDLATKSIGDIASALSGIAGVDIRNYSLINGASSISLFGSSSQQVLVLLDGLPINSPSLGVPDLGLISVNNLDRIEIVKGPTSSLYGANALGGVVNLITESPHYNTKSPSYDIGLGYGSYHTSKFDFALKDKIKNYNFILDYHQLKTNGLRTNDDGLTQGLGFISGYAFNPANRIRLDLRYETKELGSPGPKPGLSQNPIYGDSTAFSRYDRQSDTLYLIKASGEWQIKPNWDINLNSHYTNNNTNYLWVDQWSIDTSLYQDRYRSKNFIVNLINRYKISQLSNFVLGADFENNNFNASTQYPSDTSWNPSINKFGVFSEGSMTYQNIINAFASIRYDRNSGFGNFISPAIGFNSTITPYLKLRTHLGQAYRAPTMNDLYWPISGNPQIKPENGTAFQLGLDFIPNQNFSLSFTGFTRKTKNLINWLPDTVNIWRPSNIDSSTVAGLEWNGKIKVLANLQIGFNGTLQHSEQIRKEIVYDDWITQTTRFEYIKRKQAYLPELRLSSNIKYQTNIRTTIALYGNYTSSRLNYYPSYELLPNITMITKHLPAHFTISAHITQQILKQVNLTLKVDNILNTQYAEQFGNSIIDKDYPRPGRSLFIGIDIKN